MEHRLDCKNYLDENSPGYIVLYRGNFKEEIDKVDYACGDVITNRIAIISVQEKDIERLKLDVPSIVFIENRSVYVLQDISPINVDDIASVKINKYLNLTGNGVVVGIIDTGIDYLNREFIREDGTSRVIRIWDQTIQSDKNPELYIGTEYENNEINEAIKVNNEGGDPYSIVPSRDEVGHGTSMAGIIGARGYNKNIQGIANDCDFIVVKLLPSQNYARTLEKNNLPVVPVYNSSEVLSAINYISKYSSELNRPMVLYIGVGSNSGSHDGGNMVSRFVTLVSTENNIVCVAGTGNSGNAEGHSTNFISKSGEIKSSELLIPKEISVFKLEVWIRSPNRMELNITSPNGEESGYIRPNLYTNDTRQFYLSNTRVNIIGHDPESFSGNQLFILNFEDIKPGIWKISLRGEYVIDGRYDIWLEDKSLLPEGTKFLNPNPYNTLTIPSTAIGVITVAYYNGITNSIVASSGKGFNTNLSVNPDITTDGINILSVSVGSDVEKKVSGSSAATAIIAGVCALLLQWGRVNGNDTSLYPVKLRSLLIYSANREELYQYPNETLGYGTLNLLEVFSVMSGNYRSDSECLEYYIGSMFVRIPQELICDSQGGNYGK